MEYTMKLSEQTVSLLKNFSGINQNIQFKAGNKIQTISAQKNILVSAEVPESFPSDFSNYELNNLLGVMSLFQDPDLETLRASIKTLLDGGRVVKLKDQSQTSESQKSSLINLLIYVWIYD